jgi:hypothetical protein
MAEAIRLARDLDPGLCRAAARQRFSLETMTGRYFDLYRHLTHLGLYRPTLHGAA